MKPVTGKAASSGVCFLWEPQLVWKKSDPWSLAACPEGLPLPGSHRPPVRSTDLVKKVGKDGVSVRQCGGLNDNSCVCSTYHVPSPELSAISVPSHFIDMETETETLNNWPTVPQLKVTEPEFRPRQPVSKTWLDPEQSIDERSRGSRIRARIQCGPWRCD